MSKQLTAVRAIAIATICFVMAACSQTAYSTHAGHGSKKIVKNADYRKAKIRASRARAKKAREARRKAFIKKRADRRVVRAKARSGKSAKKTKRVKRKVARKSRARNNRKARRVASKRRISRKSRNRKIAKRNLRKKNRRIASAGKKRRIKKTRSAFVPNISRKAGRLHVRAPWKCVPKRLKIVIGQIRKRWGPVTVNSTWRSRKHNRRVGGKRRSYHLHCNAVDFRVHGSTRGLTRWLRRHRLVGGYNRYPSGYYHIDTGPKRTW